jgi:hypothetical protein
MAMKTPLEIIAEIQMILAEHTTSKGTISDRDCVQRIAELLDTPDAIAVALDLQPPDPGKTGRQGPDAR